MRQEQVAEWQEPFEQKRGSQASRTEGLRLESPRNTWSWRISFVPIGFVGLFLLLTPKDTKNLLQGALFLLGGLGVGGGCRGVLCRRFPIRLFRGGVCIPRGLRRFCRAAAKNMRKKGSHRRGGP